MKQFPLHVLFTMFGILLIAGLSGCNNGVSMDQLRTDTNCLYYDVSDPDKRPYTGKTYSTFGPDRGADSNVVSNVWRIENGILKGEFVVYASLGDVFEKGNVTPVSPSEDIKKLFPFVRRLSLITVDYKMPHPEFQILVVSSQPRIDSIGLSYKRDAVINFLMSKGMLNEKDTGHIMFFGVVSSELLLTDPK